MTTIYLMWVLGTGGQAENLRVAPEIYWRPSVGFDTAEECDRLALINRGAFADVVCTKTTLDGAIAARPQMRRPQSFK